MYHGHFPGYLSVRTAGGQDEVTFIFPGKCSETLGEPCLDTPSQAIDLQTPGALSHRVCPDSAKASL